MESYEIQNAAQCFRPLVSYSVERVRSTRLKQVARKSPAINSPQCLRDVSDGAFIQGSMIVKTLRFYAVQDLLSHLCQPSCLQQRFFLVTFRCSSYGKSSSYNLRIVLRVNTIYVIEKKKTVFGGEGRRCAKVDIQYIENLNFCSLETSKI